MTSPFLQPKIEDKGYRVKGEVNQNIKISLTSRSLFLFEVANRSLTRAIFVRGPNASMETSPGYSETLSTKNSGADLSHFTDLGGSREMFPNPSEPWTKSAIRGFPLCIDFNTVRQ